MYIEFPEGRLRLKGSLCFPRNKYLVLKLGNKDALCEDVMESMIVFSEVDWVGTVEENPEEKPLPVPESLKGQRRHANISFTQETTGTMTTGVKPSSVGEHDDVDGDGDADDDEMDEDANEGVEVEVSQRPRRRAASVGIKRRKKRSQSLHDGDDDDDDDMIDLLDEEEEEEDGPARKKRQHRSSGSQPIDLHSHPITEM